MTGSGLPPGGTRVPGQTPSCGEALARAAESLAGTRFRLHGRDPATGLDCIGLLAAALAAINRRTALPTGYTLRTRALPDLAALAAGCGFAAAEGALLPGDVAMVRIPPGQFHLIIAGQAGRIVHAHAGIGRITLFPGPPGWPCIGHWRLAPET